MKVLALTEGPNHVCYRYRIEAFAAALREGGWTLESLPLLPGTIQRSPQLRLAAEFDAVILQRKLLPLWQVRLLRRASRRLIYDFDDALFHRDSYSRKGPLSFTRLAHFWATIYAADAVIAGNEFLQSQAAQYVEPDKVHLLPTCVDLRLYEPARHRRRRAGARLVWIGGHSTVECLHHAQPVLAATFAQLPGLELRVICNRFPELAGVRVVPRQWSGATESRELAEADIGISWLPDDPWSLGKCGLKVLQYMAAGLPVVANRVGMNRDMVLDGETGFLAESAEEWSAAVERLADDPALRERMGRAGRDLVRERYCVESWAPRYAALIDRLGTARDASPAGDRWPATDATPRRGAAVETPA
jgi:glycosyltransferase involved in cell wall biosynthesis